MKIGIQMYSLRDLVPKIGLEETLHSVKKAGFDCIEPYCFDYGMGFEAVGAAMRKFGLCAKSMHVPYEVTADRAALGKLKDIFGIRTAVIPFLPPETLRDGDKLADMLSIASENARALGLSLAYHNHAHEFADGGSPVRLCELCPDLTLQVDVFWVKAAGIAPIDFLQENAARIWGIHMKEFGKSADDAQPIVGDGTTDAKKILAFAKAQGHETVTLEYEHTDMDEIEYITRSLQFIREQIK